MRTRLIQATKKDGQVHIFTYTKKSITVLEQLQDHYQDIVVLETKYNVIFKTVKKLFEKK